MFLHIFNVHLLQNNGVCFRQKRFNTPVFIISCYTFVFIFAKFPLVKMYYQFVHIFLNYAYLIYKNQLVADVYFILLGSTLKGMFSNGISNEQSENAIDQLCYCKRNKFDSDDMKLRPSLKR